MSCCDLMNDLEKTYDAFFGTFKKLRPIQKQTIPLVLNKKNGCEWRNCNGRP